MNEIRMKTNITCNMLTVLLMFQLCAASHLFGQVTTEDIAISTVGDPGNATDTSGSPGTTCYYGYGSVAYTFGIGTYDVTLNQYTTFLNAVATTSDLYGLYNPSLATNLNVAGIAQSGVPGNYSYSTIGDGNRPVTYVSWFDSVRFTNWLQNGQPTTGVEDATSTEDGAYTLNGLVSGTGVAKNTNATWWIPTMDESHNAACYDPSLNSGTGGYWIYATRSNTKCGNHIGGLANQANFYSNAIYPNGLFCVTQMRGYSASQNYLTPVGAFTSSTSAYGTYDQTGNVFNWTDNTIVSGSYFQWNGGSWCHYPTAPFRAADILDGPVWISSLSEESSITGFRVAKAVPESSSAMLFGLGAILLATARRRAIKK